MRCLDSDRQGGDPAPETTPECAFRDAAKQSACGDPVVEAFLLRIARVESRLGHDTAGLARNSQSRGITQVDRVLFDAMQRHPRAGAALRDAGIQTWDDLRDPAHAARFTRIALRTNPLPIPLSLEAQAAYWKIFWNTEHENAKGTLIRFLRENGRWSAEALAEAADRAAAVAAIYREAKATGLLLGGAPSVRAKRVALAALAALPWKP